MEGKVREMVPRRHCRTEINDEVDRVKGLG